MQMLTRRFDTLDEAKRYAAENPGTVFRDADDAQVKWNENAWWICEPEFDNWLKLSWTEAEKTIPLLALARPTFEQLTGLTNPPRDLLDAGERSRRSLRAAARTPDGAKIPLSTPGFAVMEKFLDHLTETLRWACEPEMSERERHGLTAYQILDARRTYHDWRLRTPEDREAYCRMAYVALDAHRAKQAELLSNIAKSLNARSYRVSEAPPFSDTSKEATVGERIPVDPPPKPPSLTERIRAVVPLVDGITGTTEDGRELGFYHRGAWWFPTDREVAVTTMTPDINHPATQGVMMAKIREVYPGGFCYYEHGDGEWVLSLDEYTDCHAPTLGEALLLGLAEAGE